MIESATLKKFERIIAIFFLLQSRTLVKGKALAEKFQVSIRTIYRDIHILQVAGVPIIGEPGSGYSIMQGYKLPPILFSSDEVLSLATVDKLAEKHLDPSLVIHFKNASEKIRNVLKYQDQVQFENLSQQIEIHQPELKYNQYLPSGLTIVFKGVTEKKQLLIQYRNRADESITERMIEPLGAFLKYRYWYIYAYCLLRNDYRHFRIDRMQSVTITNNDFTIEHTDIKTDFIINESEILRATIQMPKKYAFALDWDKHDYGFSHQEEKDELVLMHFNVIDICHSFPRWLMTYADFVEIVEPQILKDNFKNLLQNIINKQGMKSDVI